MSFFLLGFTIAEPLFLFNIITLNYKGFNEFFARWIIPNVFLLGDNLTITWTDWLSFILQKYITFIDQPEILIFAVILLTLILISYCLLQTSIFIKSKSCSPGIVIFFAGALSVLMTILNVKRLWFFYLHHGFIFMLIGIFTLAEQQFKRKKIFLP